MSTSVAWAFLTFGLRNAGTPLATASTPVSAEQPLENARRTSRMNAACVSDCALHRVLGARGDRWIAERCAPETDDDHERDRPDEDVRRKREDERCLADASEVHDDDDDHEADGELDAAAVERRDRRDDVVDTRGDRHGDRQDVVDQQRRRHDDARDLAEVLRRDLVVAAARGVGLDELAVADHDHREHHDDGDARSTARRPGTPGRR